MRDFILVEGINLYANIYDTDQLSVIRGTSFLYKDAIEALEKNFANTLDPISTGASSGLFGVKPTSPTSSATLVEEIQAFLQQDKNYRLLTFGIAQVTADTLPAAKEQLLTQLRFNQLQNLTLQADQLGDSPTIPCELEGSRLAPKTKHPQTIQGKVRQLSESVFKRWTYGRKKRHTYYAELVGDALAQRLEHYDFADDINTLCADPSYPLDAQGKPPSFDEARPFIYPKLAGKMAVIYIDGNKFGAVQKEFIAKKVGNNSSIDQEIEAQQNFDQAIKALRNQFLADEIARHLTDEEQTTALNPLGHQAHNQQKKILRLETLLWGGDEMLLVMPAWKGMDFLQRFFAFPWQLEGVEQPLTHAAGVVFCQAKTPIRIIQALARSLAEDIKDGKPYGRTQNAWDYLVLESIDYPTNNSLNDYFKKRYGKVLTKTIDEKESATVCSRNQGLPAITDWSATRATLQTVLEERHLPRRKLYHVLQALREQGVATDACTWLDVINLSDEALTSDKLCAQTREEYRLFQVSEYQQWLQAPETQTDSWTSLAKQCFGLDINQPCERAWAWIHMVELWDYLTPEPQNLPPSAFQTTPRAVA